MTRNYHSFPHAGIGVPSESPFFPITSFDDNGNIQARFNQGFVLDFDTIADNGEATIITVSGMEQFYSLSGGDKFYVKIDASTVGSITASFLKGEATASEDPNIFYIKVCEFNSKKEPQEIVLRENIHWKASGETALHPWKITRSSPIPKEGGGDPDPNNWMVRGSTIYSNNQNISIGNTEIAGNNGWIYLKIGRDIDSRALDLANTEIGFSESDPESFYSEQYVLLGYINDGEIEQKTFEEIRIQELMIIENGEFRLAPLQLSSTNIYEPPPS